MKQVIEFPLEAGGSILVEVDEPEDIMRAPRPGEVISRAERTFETALDNIQPVAQSIIAKLRSLIDTPDEVEVQFSLKLTAEAGMVVAAGGVEAHYKVTLRWKR